MVAMARVALVAPMLTLLGIGAVFAGRGEIDLHSVLWSWVAARVIVALGTVLAAWRGGWVSRPRPAALASDFRFAAVIGLTNLVGLLNYKVDLFLVERLVGLSQTGVYSVAVMVAELLWLVSSSISQAAYARIGNPDAAEASRITLRAVHSSFIALSVLGPVLWLVAAWVLPHLLGHDYAAAMPALALRLPGVVAYGAASALSAYFTNHAGRPHIAAGLAGMSLVLTIAFSLLLIPHWGMLGAAAATTISYLASIGVSVGVFCMLSGVPLRQLLRPDWYAMRNDLGRLRTRMLRV
jgi:O-antigen/teichoic acid export membrane protein